MKSLSTLFALSLTIAAIFVAGCSNDSSTGSATSGPETSGPPNTVDDHAGHAHPSEGPHHGDLIELGNEEYHAELLHPEDHDDDAHPAGDEDGHEHTGITIYVLDSSATKMVPIGAADVTINLTHDGKPEQFRLAAMPTETDPAGKSSRFASDSHDLLEHFHEAEHVEGTLVLSINGKSYRGKISHEHDHDGHPHGDEDPSDHNH